MPSQCALPCNVAYTFIFRWSEVIDDFKSKQFHRCRVLGKLTHNIYEVSLRDSRIAGDLDNDKAPSVGEHVEGFVISTNKAG